MLQRIAILTIIFATSLQIGAMAPREFKMHMYEGKREKKVPYSNCLLNFKFKIDKKRQSSEKKELFTPEESKNKHKRIMEKAQKMTSDFQLPVAAAQKKLEKTKVASIPVQTTHAQEMREEHHDSVITDVIMPIPSRSSELLKITDSMSATLTQKAQDLLADGMESKRRQEALDFLTMANGMNSNLPNDLNLDNNY